MQIRFDPAQVSEDATLNVRDELEQVAAVDGAVAEAGSALEPVRVQAATADVPDLALQALWSQGSGADLSGDRRRVIKRVIKAARGDVRPGIGSAWVGGTERVELLYGTVGVYHDQGAGQQAKAFYPAGLAEHELDDFTEHPDVHVLPRCGVPPVEYRDQPVRVARAWWRATPVGVRQQQVDRRGAEREQCLVSGDGVVAGIDRAQDAAVTVAEFRRPQEIQAVGDRAETVASVGVAAVPARCLSIAVEADANADPESLQDLEQRAAKQGAIGLHGHVHLRWDGGPE